MNSLDPIKASRKTPTSVSQPARAQTIFRGIIMFLKRLRALFLSVLMSVPLLATAGPFSSIFVFGDSLSDTGNLLNTGTIPPFPLGPTSAYFNNRFSTGPLWIEYLANGLGLVGQANTFTTGGNNFAFAGANTGPFPPVDPLAIPSLQTQAIGIFGQGGTLAAVDPGALYVVVAGGNDMRDARNVPGADAASLGAAAANAYNNIGTTIGYLASLGAKNFLVSNLPDLGMTPEAALLGLQGKSTLASNIFNGFLPGFVGFEQSQGLNMFVLDIASVTTGILANPSAYGITNTTSPCIGFYLSDVLGGAPCNQSAYADVLHPTAIVHAALGREALHIFGIPEPETLALFGVAFIALVVTRRRKSV
jgi:outer membrane lipase/esterase